MQNQEIINSIGHLLIEKNIYVDMNTIALLGSYLDPETLLEIQEDLEEIDD